MKKHPYYNFDRLMSFNGVYNFCVGGRGLGKTFGAKQMGMKRGVKSMSQALDDIEEILARGGQFVYLRRYETELKEARPSFLADIQHRFPNQDWRVEGKYIQFAPIATRDDKKRRWHVAGYFIALSRAQHVKSVSFPLVSLIIYDEFILEKTNVQYLPNEATLFNNFYNTVDRSQDKTRVLFLANSVSIDNPFFLAYDIRPVNGEEWIIKADGFIVVHLPKAEEYAASVGQTRFGKFITQHAPEYAEYAMGNVFHDNNAFMVALKESGAEYMFSLRTVKGEFSVWYEAFDGVYYCQQKLPKQQIKYVNDPSLMTDETMLMDYTDKQGQALRFAFKANMMKFDSPQTRNAFVQIFKR